MWGRRSPLDVEVAAHVPDEDLAVPPALHPAARRRDQLRGIVPFVGHAAGATMLRDLHDDVWRPPSDLNALSPSLRSGSGDGFPLRSRRLPREVRHEQVHRAGVDHGDDLENAGDAERFQRGATEVVLDLVDRGHWS